MMSLKEGMGLRYVVPQSCRVSYFYKPLSLQKHKSSIVMDLPKGITGWLANDLVINVVTVTYSHTKIKIRAAIQRISS